MVEMIFGFSGATEMTRLIICIHILIIHIHNTYFAIIQVTVDMAKPR